MLRPFMQTLKLVVVDNDFYHDDVDPLFGIPSELEDMRSKHIIEIMVRWRANYRRRDDWGHSRLLTRYSQLRGGFRWSRFHWLWRSLLVVRDMRVTSWKRYWECCLRRNFRDCHLAIPFHSISRLSRFLSGTICSYLNSDPNDSIANWKENKVA